MLKRAAIVVAVTIAVLALIDFASSSLVHRPCLIEKVIGSGSKQNPNEENARRACAYQGGIIVVGISYIFSWKPEVWTAIGTLVIAAFTTILGLFTVSLARSTRIHAEAALRQTNVIVAVKSPSPLVVEIKLVQFAQIPGETTVADPLPPGPIQPHCRIIITFENKGRAPCRMRELCIEKFAGNALPTNPIYTHIVQWPLVLERGPVPIRGTEDQVVVTAADAAAAAAAYASGGAFWIYGYFAYLNLFDARQELRFLVRWDPQSQLRGGFVPDNRPGYV